MEDKNDKLEIFLVNLIKKLYDNGLINSNEYEKLLDEVYEVFI